MLTLLTAVAFTSLSPQVVEREVFQTLTKTEQVTVAPGVGQQFNAADIFLDEVLPFDLPDDDGVTFVRARVTTTIWAEALIEAVTLDVTGTRFSGFYEMGLASCSSGCQWGASDYWGTASTFGNPTTVHPPGTTVLLNPALCREATPCVFNSGGEVGISQWSSVLLDPSARAISELYSLDLRAFNDAAAPTPFQLNSWVVNAGVQIEVTNTFELETAPLTEYCTSPVGSTGAAATLEAYGSQQENTEFLTIRAQGLPQGSFAVLFVGTAPVNQPMGSTTLCVGGAVTRMGGVANAATGAADFDIDLLGRAVGTQLFLQSYFRDTAVGVAATNASSFVIQPRI